MAENNSLLSFVALRHTIGLEDVATDALSFILSRSDASRQALSELLGVQVAKAKPWAANEFGALPDLACFDGEDNLVAFVESKFWAPPTYHQPVTYWEGLPDNRPAVLLFLAPRSRVDQGSLWEQLEGRLRNARHELGPADRDESLIRASAKDGQPQLMLTSWESLLDKMAQAAKNRNDTQASFEIAELRSLADSAIARDNPQRDENLKRLIADAVKRVEQSGWANTDGLTVGKGFGHYGGYLRLAGAYAWLGIDDEARKQMPNEPLLLSFYGDCVEGVRSRLASSAEPDLEWRSKEVPVPIELPVAADQGATLDAIVAKLERIGSLIDPDGPTYRAAS